MITGSVTAYREALIKLRLRGPKDLELEVDAVIDTGFTSALSLPQDLIDALDLARVVLHH